VLQHLSNFAMAAAMLVVVIVFAVFVGIMAMGLMRPMGLMFVIAVLAMRVLMLAR